MRLISWAFGWILYVWTGRITAWQSLSANLASLGLFVGFLFWNLMPNEPFDFAALVFGVVVYAGCFVTDLRWLPWHRQAGKRMIHVP
ncbi:MAG TPA: hypothetical protein P5186_27250 [Candidatus Paceibacterota bacterium]|nr:hypothetical protein [Candidatus Paceibacterota bacterium]HSA02376.1 hypothetical protein [Candidatus Paceibacterota bacterium]